MDGTSTIIASQPPVIRRLCHGLIHLPVEIVHHIMCFCDVSDARRLGFICQIFREVSMSYIYTVS